MKTLRDKISILIHQATLRGRLPKLEEKIFTDTLNYYIDNKPGGGSLTENEVVLLLNQEIINIQNRKEKLNNPNSLDSLGDYLKLIIEERSLNTNEICENCKIKITFFTLLLENKIRVLDFGAEKIAKFTKYLNLKSNLVKELLAKTIQLNALSFSEQKALASYIPHKVLTTQPHIIDNNEVINNFLNEFDKYYSDL